MRAQWRTQNVFFRPGEIWVYEDLFMQPVLTYFGPSRKPNPCPERSIRNAFWAATRGDAVGSIEMLQKHHTAAQILELEENKQSLVEAVLHSNSVVALDAVLTRFPQFAKPRFMRDVVDRGHTTMVRTFMKHGARPTVECIRCAVSSRLGSVELFDLLVSSGTDFDACCMLYYVKPWTPIEIVANRLLPTGVACWHAWTPLLVHWLMQGGDFAIHMRAVAEIHPQAVDVPNHSGWTPLMLAAGGLDPSNVECLLDLNADVGAWDDQERQALDWCLAATEMPEWYVDAYHDSPASFEFDEDQRSANAELIHDMLSAAMGAEVIEDFF